MGYFEKLKIQMKHFLTRKSYTSKHISHEQVIFDEELKPGSRLWLFLLCLSSAVILAKYLSDYGNSTLHAYKSAMELDFDVINALYQIVINIFIYVWRVICRLQWILIPSLFSAVFIGFSWVVLYKDSNIPGVNPPTPFSPSRYRRRCDRSMDFSYALTGTFGVLIFLRMLYQSLRESD